MTGYLVDRSVYAHGHPRNDDLDIYLIKVKLIYLKINIKMFTEVRNLCYYFVIFLKCTVTLYNNKAPNTVTVKQTTPIWNHFVEAYHTEYKNTFH